MRVVFDTNVWVSGLAFRGEIRKILEMAMEQEIQPVVSPFLLGELERVLLGKKFGFPPAFVSAAVQNVQMMSHLVHPTRKIGIIHQDPSDNRILECALEGEADFIVSGDKHLLGLGIFHGIRILKPNQFLNEIES